MPHRKCKQKLAYLFQVVCSLLRGTKQLFNFTSYYENASRYGTYQLYNSWNFLLLRDTQRIWTECRNFTETRSWTLWSKIDQYGSEAWQKLQTMLDVNPSEKCLAQTDKYKKGQNILIKLLQVTYQDKDFLG